MLKYLSIIIVLFVVACGDMEKEIPWETKNIPHNLIVEGSITTDLEYQCIKLKLSGDYFENKPPTMVTNASVEVVSSLGTYIYIEADTAPGSYYSEIPFVGIVGESYVMNVNLDEPIEGTSDFSASALMRKPMQIDTIYCNTYENPFAAFDDTDTTLLVILNIIGLEPPGEDNYYLMKLYRNHKIMNDTVTSYQIFTDFDYGMDGATDMYMSIFSVPFFPNDTIDIEVHSVTEHYYDFVYGCQLISQPQDPFGFMGPPANAVGNVNDGTALGYFYATCIARGSTIVSSAEDGNIQFPQKTLIRY